VSDQECPHGLDPAWCTLCKQPSLPSGVKRLAPRPPARARRASTARPQAPAARTPAEAFSTLRKVLFHASSYGAWPSIAELGLRPAAALAGAGGTTLDRLRESDLVVTDGDGRTTTIRDQRTLVRANIAQHLQDIDLAEWLRLLNDRVFLFAQQKSLTTLLSRYVPTGGQDVVVFDTARVLASARGRVEVITDELAAPEPWAHCPCRGRDTFIPFDRYRGAAADIFEVAIVGGLEDVSGLVSRVVRYHPDRTTEVLVP
jgi:hypothetical protein